MFAIGAPTGDHTHAFEVSSGFVKRVCKSMLTGEATNLVAVLEATDYLRSVLVAFLKPSAGLHMRMDRGDLIFVQVYTGTTFLYDVAVPDTSWPQDDRLRVVFAHFRDMMHVTGHGVVLDRYQHDACKFVWRKGASRVLTSSVRSRPSAGSDRIDHGTGSAKRIQKDRRAHVNAACQPKAAE